MTCAAAPSLFYADWVEPIPAECPRLAALRAELLALPPVARAVDEARPYRGYFPPGAPHSLHVASLTVTTASACGFGKRKRACPVLRQLIWTSLSTRPASSRR